MNIEKTLKALTLEEKAGLCAGADFWRTEAVSRLGIPSVMMCDGPNGLRKQKSAAAGNNESIETVCYPTASALACSFDPEALRQLGGMLGRECAAEQVGMLLGPGLNMKRSPLCGRNFEYLSEDPFLAGELAAACVSGLQQQGTDACVKHFAANSQETRRMSGDSRLDERTLREIYLPAFETAVRKGKTKAVMCAYNAVNGTFCSENRSLLTGILRDEWGFRGMVVTDWGAVKDRVTGLAAGVDLEMPGPGRQKELIVQAVQSGKLPQAVLDRAVRRVLAFVSRHEPSARPAAPFDRETARELSGQLAEQCAVLLKNDGLLPLSRQRKTALIGAFAKAPRYQGAGSSHVNVPHPVSALEAAEGLPVVFAAGYRLRQDGPDDETLLREAVGAAVGAEAAVVFAGLPDAAESEGSDRVSMDLPAAQNRLIEAVAAVQPNTVVVLHGGSPMALPWLPRVRAVLCMYLGGERSGAAEIRLLYGDAVPGGKLAETWPVKLADTPASLEYPAADGCAEYREGVFIGYRYYDKKQMAVQFPFGHGLSYTTFEYSGLSPKKAALGPDGTLRIACRVRNAGARAGCETVQLYIRSPLGGVPRPVRELKGFRKISLAPGRSKTVSFTLSRRAFSYFEPKIGGWYAPDGEYAVEIGSSSRDLRLSAAVSLTGAAELPVTYTARTPLADLEKTAAGREFFAEILAAVDGEAQKKEEADAVRTMGEGAGQMMHSMMMEMPLGSLVDFGRLSEQQMNDVLKKLNEKP